MSHCNLNKVESLLETRQQKADDILYSLGFGGQFDGNIEPLMRVPVRFFECQSNAKGILINDLIHIRNKLFLFYSKQKIF